MARQYNIDSSNDLLCAAKVGAKWMRWWLEQNECECEYGHTCGRKERQHELEQIERAIEKYESI